MPFPPKPACPNQTAAPAWLLGLLLLAVIATGSRAARAVILEDFESGTPTLESADPVQDVDPTAWNVTTSESYGGSGHSLRLYGNTWKAQPITPYPVTAGMVWQCAALVTTIGEMQAFGVTDGTNLLYYTFEGTQLPVTDPWSAVYQGAFPEEEWNLFLLPIAQDWLNRYGYLPTITKLIYVNDCDAGDTGTIYFDEIADVTADLPQAPSVQIVHGRQSVEKLASSLYRVTIQFGSQVYDPDTPPEALTYRWDFGDGTTGAGPSVTHIYTAPGLYTVSVTASDGLATDTTSIVIAVNGNTAGVDLSKFSVTKVSLKFNFSRAASDSIAVSGTFPVADKFNPSGKAMIVAMGGYTSNFTLGAKGSAKSSNDAIKFTGKMKKGIYTASPVKFSFTVKKRDLFANLSSFGFTNADVGKPGAQVQLKLLMGLDGTFLLGQPMLGYTAKKDKAGLAVKKK
jgi:hypothetical protein